MTAPSSAKKLPVHAKGRSASAPLYRQVVDILRKQIGEGVYPAGGQLPAEDELGQTFSVSRHTVREALRRLRDEGLIVSRQGSGTTVALAAPRKSYLQEVDSIEDLIQYARTVRYQVDSSEIVKCDQRLARLIGAEVGTQWLRVDGMRYEEKGAVPACRTTVYVAAEYAGVGRLVARGHTAIYQMIEDLYGETMAEVEQTIRGTEATKAVAADLQIATGDAMVEVKRVYFTTSGKRAEVAINLFPYKRFSSAMTLRRH